MIYTVTFNPSIDLFVEADLSIGEVNRVSEETYTAGGKGINVSKVCKTLGVNSIATGFIGDFTGAFIQKELSKEKIKSHFVDCQGISRINMKIHGVDKTEINLQGVKVNKENAEELLTYLKENIKQGDILVISGNAANGITKEHYTALAKVANEKQALCVIDTSLANIEGMLEHKPFLVKPNIHELAGMFKQSLSSEDDIVNFARKLQKEGAVNVIASMGAKGYVFVGEKEVLFGDPINGEIVSSTGASDAMIAGFICEWIKSADYEAAFKMSMATNAACLFSSGLATHEEILSCLKKARISD